jgi:serine/threonine protein kinase
VGLETKMKTTVGTPLYMSLEILKSLEYTSKCDIWALGFIFYELLHGETPWRGNREYELANNIEHQPLAIRRKDLSPDTVSFLKGTLQIYEKDRLSWNEVFMHPIFNGLFVSMADENREF